MSIIKNRSREVSWYDITAPSDLKLWSEYLDRRFLMAEIALELDDGYNSMKNLRRSTASVSSYGDIPVPRPSILSLTWEMSKDNPHNWTKWKKAFHTFVPTYMGCICTLSSSIYTPGIDQVVSEFHTSKTIAILPFSCYVLGLAFGPMIASPLSETLGRRIVYLICVPIFALCTLGAAFSSTITALIVSRFFAGMFSSPALTVGAGTIADLYKPEHRAIPVAAYVAAPFLGPAFGPLLGGYTVHLKSWRWTQLLTFFLTASLLLLASIGLRETYQKHLIRAHRKKFGRLQPENSYSSYYGVLSPPRPSRSEIVRGFVTQTLTRPLHMLFSEPIVGLFSLYVAFCFALQYAFFVALPDVFARTYGFGLIEQGLAFIGLGVGVLATFVGLVIREVYKKRAVMDPKRTSHGGQIRAPGTSTSAVRQACPEDRLTIAFPATIFLPAALFLFAFTCKPNISPFVPTIGLVLFGASIMLIFMSCTGYLADCYGAQYGASAMAANTLLRYLSGFALPLVMGRMYDALGTQRATIVLGGVAILLVWIPFGFWKFGKRLRSTSKYKVEGL